MKYVWTCDCMKGRYEQQDWMRIVKVDKEDRCTNCGHYARITKQTGKNLGIHSTGDPLKKQKDMRNINEHDETFVINFGSQHINFLD